MKVVFLWEDEAAGVSPAPCTLPPAETFPEEHRDGVRLTMDG